VACRHDSFWQAPEGGRPAAESSYRSETCSNLALVSRLYRRIEKLPAVLSGAEVNKLLSCVKCHKHRVFLLTQYAAGMRLNEAAHLKISDIDSQRM